jgi:tRNA (guanine10-N2)-dimethyltransferase
MKILCKLSGIHPSLPSEEIIGILESESIPYKIIKQFKQIIIIEITNSKYKTVIDRAAFSKSVHQFLFETSLDLEMIKENLSSINLDELFQNQKNYMVRIDKIKLDSSEDDYLSSQELESKIGNLILKLTNKSIKVDLEQPDLTFKGFIINNKLFFGIKLGKIDLEPLHKRSGPNKAYFHPCGLDPKFARMMVNLAGIDLNSVIYDPHCGIGSILIEAALIGYRVMGSDISWKMIHGSRVNLNHYKISDFQIFRAESGHLPIKQIDCIITDPPYGRSSPVEGNSIISLYQKFLYNCREIVHRDNKIVFAAPKRLEDKIMEILKSYNFIVDKKFDFYIHRSLIRNLWIIRLI